MGDPVPEGKVNWPQSQATGTAQTMHKEGFKSQAHLRHDSTPNTFNRFGRRLWNGLTRITDALEHYDQSGEKQVIFGQITERNVAKMLAGLSKPGGTMQTEPFTRNAAFASLGYLGSETNRPREYAAMLYALRELKREDVIEEQPNPNAEGTYWFKVNPQRQVELTNIANRTSEEDKSLSRELTMLPGGAEQKNAFVNDFLRRNEVQLAA
jgi:hypothetical protein